MTETNSTMYEKILDHIFKNKKYPYYSAETRLEPMFSIFLGDILDHAFRKKSIEYICNEFPIKLDDNNQSKEIDMVCFDKNGNQVYFVELKTDTKSLNSKQIEFYMNHLDWKKNINGLRKKVAESDEKLKYACLLDTLLKTGLVRFDKNSDNSNRVKLENIVENKFTGSKKARSTEIIRFYNEVKTRVKKQCRLVLIYPDNTDSDRDNCRRIKSEIKNAYKNPTKIKWLPYSKIRVGYPKYSKMRNYWNKFIEKLQYP